MSVSLSNQLQYPVCLSLRETEKRLVDYEDDRDLARPAPRDEDAFAELVRRHHRAVYGLLYQYVRNAEDARDLVQETFVKAHRGLESYRSDASFKTWVYRIASNTAKDFLKKKRLRVIPLDDAISDSARAEDPGPAELAAGHDLGEAMKAALGELTEDHRLALTLREIDGLSYDEIAEVMECKLGTVMSRLHTARRKLREILVERGAWEEA